MERGSKPVGRTTKRRINITKNVIGGVSIEEYKD